MSFLMPKAAPLPPPPPPPAPPPPAPDKNSEAVEKAEKEERDRLRRQAGRKASILTTSRGLLNDAPAAVDQPSLMGGTKE